MAEETVDTKPLSLDDIIADLSGFGIEDSEEILTVKTGGKQVGFRISNMCPQEEVQALIAAEELKGHAWIQRIKCEILSRAISYIQLGKAPGINIRVLPSSDRWVKHPVTGEKVDIQVALRDSLLGWGQELVGVLWKVLMTHSQRVEDRIFEQFPDSAILTDVEKRFMQQAMDEIEEATRKVVADEVSSMPDPEQKD